MRITAASQRPNRKHAHQQRRAFDPCFQSNVVAFSACGVLTKHQEWLSTMGFRCDTWRHLKNASEIPILGSPDTSCGSGTKVVSVIKRRHVVSFGRGPPLHFRPENPILPLCILSATRLCTLRGWSRRAALYPCTRFWARSNPHMPALLPLFARTTLHTNIANICNDSIVRSLAAPRTPAEHPQNYPENGMKDTRSKRLAAHSRGQ